MTKRLFLLPLLLLLTALTPAQKRILLQQSNQSCDAIYKRATARVRFSPAADLAPIRHFLLEDNAASTTVTDSTGTENAGSARNTSLMTTASGKIIRGFEFVDDDSILLSTPVGSGTFTFCAWAKPNVTGADGVLFIGTGTDLSYSYFKADYTLQWDAEVLTGVSWAASTWRHYCFVRSGTSGFVYQNGVLSATHTPNTGVAVARIGNRSANDRDYIGTLDDIRIYNRALSISEIQAIYNNGAGHQNESVNAKNGVGLDQSGRVINVTGSQGISFLNATAASRPTLTRADNRENRVLYSEDVSQASYWNITAGIASVTSTTITEDTSTGNHYVGSTLTPVVAASSYRLAADVKRGVGSSKNVRLSGVSTGLTNATIDVDLNDCSVHAVGSTVTSYGSTLSDGYCSIWLIASSEAADTSNGPILWLSDGSFAISYTGTSESIVVRRLQMSSSLSDSTYIATTDYPQYRGVNGKRCAYFDGGDYLSSTSTIGDVFAAGSKTFAIALNPTVATAATYQSVLNGAGGHFAPIIATGGFSVYNNDGAADTIAANLLSANKPNLALGTHGSGYLGLCVNGSCVTPIASGNTSTTTGALYVGATSVPGNYYTGYICDLITFNTALSSSDRIKLQRCLAKDWGVDLQ